MGRHVLPAAILRLQEQFPTLNWTYHDVSLGGQTVKMNLSRKAHTLKNPMKVYIAA